MKKILIVACTFGLCAGSVFGKEVNTLALSGVSSFPASTYEVGKNTENYFAEKIDDKDIYINKTEKVKTRSWLETCANFAQASFYLSRIGLGSAVFAGSAALKGVYWGVRAAPFFPPVPDSWNKFWVNKALGLARYAISGCTRFIVNSTPSWFPKVSDDWINSWVDCAGGKVSEPLTKLASTVSSGYGSFYEFALPFPKKVDSLNQEMSDFVNKWKAKDCGSIFHVKSHTSKWVAVDGGSALLNMLESKFVRTITSNLCKWTGWLLAVAVNHYGKDVIHKVKEVSDSGMKHGKNLAKGGFKDLKGMWNY